MRLISSELEIETIVRRIQRDDIDLQPEFQRNEIWSTKKKQLLIDSILRNWYVPPIHLVETSESKLQVLDGQQRLIAIRDFAENAFTVDGQTSPRSSEIQAIDGLLFEELPPPLRRRFMQHSIRAITLTDYEPEEPSELFFRLNQPSSLTTGEKRNALFGAARPQVKQLVDRLDVSTLGFSNSRLSHDDVLARVCTALELRTLHIRITSTMVDANYRTPTGFSRETIANCGNAIDALTQLTQASSDRNPRLNKASLFSWLIFLSRFLTLNNTIKSLTPEKSSLTFFSSFETDTATDLFRQSSLLSPTELMGVAHEIYGDRVTSRVSDSSSVLLRDFALWLFAFEYVRNQGKSLRTPAAYVAVQEDARSALDIWRESRDAADAEPPLLRALERTKWGVLTP